MDSSLLLKIILQLLTVSLVSTTDISAAEISIITDNTDILSCKADTVTPLTSGNVSYNTANSYTRQKVLNLQDSIIARNGTRSKAGKENDYSKYSGRTIRRIKYIRLDPFGTSITNQKKEPEAKSDILFNKTHLTTRESVIKSYLLFVSGDTVSEIPLSETERNIRNLTFINDVRIEIIPVDKETVDVIVITRDNYSLGADYDFRDIGVGEISFFEKNIAGYGHEIEIGLPHDVEAEKKGGLRLNYKINNIVNSYANINLFLLSKANYRDYGFTLSRDFSSAESKYAGAATVRETFTTADIGEEEVKPLEFAYQDYWFARSFLLHRESRSRLIVGLRYIHNNVYERPEIDHMSYYSLQKYRLYLASITFSKQKYSKMNYIYNYGRTEDIPYGLKTFAIGGREYNEFKERTYISAGIAFGLRPGKIGYLNTSLSVGSFLEKRITEQGVISLSASYNTNLISAGSWKIRNFVDINYTKGFDRYSDESLTLEGNGAITGLRNDSLRGDHRLVVNIESVFFSPVTIYGFQFVIFGYSDLAFLGSTENLFKHESPISVIGAGLRVRNDNLVIKTLQIRIGYYPRLPDHSQADHFHISGERLLRPSNFDAAPPQIIKYR